jgi:hypothetical protein
MSDHISEFLENRNIRAVVAYGSLEDILHQSEAGNHINRFALKRMSAAAIRGDPMFGLEKREEISHMARLTRNLDIVPHLVRRAVTIA